VTTGRVRRPLTAWAFLAPYLAAVGLLIALPALLNLGYGFTDHTGLTRDPQYVGLANVRRLLSDGFLLDSLEASLFHVALAVPVRLLAAVGLGLLLAAPRRGGRWFRTAVYLPTVIPDVALEGCGPFGQLRRLTLPLLAPVLVLLAVRDTILTLQVNFVPAYVLTDGRPANATLYLPVYIFDQVFEFSGFAYGSVITIVLMAVTAAIITAQLIGVRRWRVLR